MKRLLPIFLLLFTAIVYPQQPMNHNSVVEINESEVYYEDGKFLLKLYDRYAYIDLSSEGANISATAIVGISELNIKYKVKSIKKLFAFVRIINKQPHDLTTIYEIEYDNPISPIEISKLYAEIPEVEFAEPDYIASILVNPNDPYYKNGSQTYHSAVKANDAWELSTGDATQIISIIDTGVDWGHQDLADNIWINTAERDGTAGVDDDGNGFVDDIRGWDFVNDDNNPMDDNSHGTHVAGIAGAKTNNDIGIAGISWNSKLMAIKVMQSSGRGSASDIAQGVTYSAENGSTVINMSLGSYSESLTLKYALENAYNKSVLVAAAGNDGLCIIQECMVSAAMFPACYPWVLGVQASQASSGTCGIRACWSNNDPSGPTSFRNQYGYNYEILAPGQNIYSTIPGNGYKYLSGTSMATPITSGAVALIKSYLPNISTEELFARIIQACGSGVLDIEGAMTIQLIPDVRLESFTIVDTLTGCDRDGRADAGETVLINIKVKNYGGWAQNVKAELKLGEFEDKSVTIFIDSISSLQNISSYAQVNNNDNPFKITIPENIANNRDIVFTIKTKADNWLSTNSKIQTVTIENGIEFSGIYEGQGAIILKPNKYYMINGPFICDTLILEPGAILRIGDNVYVNRLLLANGKPDSLITIQGLNGGTWTGIKSKYIDEEIVKNYYFLNYGNVNDMMYSTNTHIQAMSFNNCILTSNKATPISYSNTKNSIIHGNISSFITGLLLNNVIINNNLSSLSTNSAWYNFPTKAINLYSRFYLAINNSFINNYRKTYVSQSTIGILGPWGYYICPPQYYGTFDSTKIEYIFNDFFDDGARPFANKTLRLTKPFIDAHGHVWQVLVNNVNTYDDVFEPVGSETVKFDVYFNRAMDTNFTPFLTFGIREPYTQKVVIDSAKWISWKQDENIGDTYYHLQVSDKSDFSNLIINKNDILDLNYQYNLNGNKEYFWKVRYKNGTNGDWYEWSEVKSFKTKETRKAKVPNIIYPINNDSTNSAFFLLLEEDLFVQKYFYQLATDENFSNIINSDTITNIKKYLQSLVAGQSYYLRAKTFNTFGNSEFSSIVKFKVRSSNNYAAPNLITPINNDTTYNITNRVFKWNNVPWAVKYQFQIGTTTAFTTLNHESFVTDTTVKFFENLPLGIKYWRVKAINGSIESPWSQVYKFNIPTKTVNISLDSVFTYNLITYNGGGLDSNEIAILPDGTYYWRFGTESIFNTIQVVNKKCQTNIPIDKAKWMDTNVTFCWNNGPKANTVYNARWQAYHTMDFTTGDGLQMIRVAGAKDNEGFEIPVEWNRFQFEVQATAALSNDFIAEGKVGKIDLEWGMPDVERDILGFNLYRFVQKDSITWGDTVKVNNILIVDSTYSDYNIIPDSTYYYVYRIVRTTLDEGEDSRMVSASAYPTVLDPPALLYPPADTTKLPINITFDWDEPSGATNYILQVARDLAFSNIVFEQETIESQYLASGLSNRTQYFWRVKAEGIQGTSVWSNARKFTTIPVIPDVPQLNYPENNSVGMAQALTFSWGIANQADNYQLQIATDLYFGTIVYDIANLTTNSRYISNLAINKTYYWRVRSKNDAGFSNWSAKWQFTTDTAGATPPPATWNFTDNTGNNAVVVVPKNINPRINGRDILPGDAIGVFYLSQGQYKSAGYEIWEGQNLAITVWGDDEQTAIKDGYAVNEKFILKLWDSRQSKEFFAEITFSSGPDKYTINGISILGMLNSVETVTQNIIMKQGWNLISSNLSINQPDSMQYIWSNLQNRLVIMKNQAGKIYLPNSVNQIGSWNIEHGYQVYVNQLCTLSVDGLKILPEQKQIPLNTGWSIVPYLRNSNQNIILSFVSLTDENRLVIAKNNGGKIYMPSQNINTIGNMIPGEGYQAYLNARDTLIYPPNAIGRTSSSNHIDDFDSRIIKIDYENTGNNASIIMDIDLADNTEIAVMNSDNKIVGAGRVVDGRTAIVIWGDDESTNAIDGSVENQELRIMNYDTENSKYNEVNNLDLTDIITGKKYNKLTYNKDAVLIGKALTQPITLKVNPNPFSNSTEVIYTLAEDCEIELSLYNLSGMKVLDIANGKLTKGTHKLTINTENITSGTYNVILKSCGKSVVEKVVVVR